MVWSLFISFFSMSQSNALTISTWNMQWLDNQSSRQEARRTPSDYSALNNIVTTINSDLIAFQEVANLESAHLVFDPELYHIELSSRSIIGHVDTDWRQYVGFAIRKEVNYMRNPDLFALDVTRNHALRYGVDITLLFEERPPVRVLVVHLKSGCHSKKAVTGVSCKRLSQQASVINQWIVERNKSQSPFIILGDFNRQLINENDWFWQRMDHNVVKVGVGQVSQCRSAHIKSNNNRWYFKQYKTFIDHILISKGLVKYVTGGSFKQTLFSGSDLAQYRLSDHCPLSIKFTF
ncbi:endonuclease/exonuclease/phosphatase family protein [Aliivibrio kagoshimensis]|uniref:endonuclease/exonuclease/phosphatase family protein n=1 Tax=Aliivibrio kagoshimensis TaxID=2910230 RepID=UPI003D132FBB